MKKILVSLVFGQFLFVMAGVTAFAQAQTTAGAAAAGGGYATPAAVVTPTNIATPIGEPTIAPPPDSGFIQFDNLTVENVSSQSAPAEILASNGDGPIEVMNGGGSGGGSGVIAPGVPVPSAQSSGAATLNSIAPSAPTAPAAQTQISGGTCYQFETEDATQGTAIPCPTPPAAVSSSPTSAASVTSMPNPPMPAVPVPTTGAAASMPNIPAGVTSPSPTMYPVPPFYYHPYRIEVSATTELMLRDRTVAALSDFSGGDQINVFGYYNADGSIQAYLIRNVSKPAVTQTIQLNNVTILSISGTSIPATLAVTQEQSAPCYSFGSTGAKQPYACPMGVSTFSGNSAAANIAVPPSVAPDYVLLRKYVITIDAQTVILDSNRTQLPLSSLNAGDNLNVYGETSDNGQTINADIVRDLSIPAVPSDYQGTITQVNADGSFIIQLASGQTITVQSPVAVGASVTVHGLLDPSTNILSQVSAIYTGSTVAMPPSGPIPAPMPMMLRVNGAPAPASTTTNGPNIY